MKDYYSVLGVPDSSGEVAIRQAYRAKAKEMHPDYSGGHEDFIILKEAYEILSEPATRDAYDRGRRAEYAWTKDDDWDYGDFLRERMDEPEMLTRLICFDLLHDSDDEAVRLFEQGGGIFLLKKCLGREDFMDFAFLLAEAYLERGAKIRAYRLLKGVADLEEEDAWFRHFYVEVLERLSRIVHGGLDDDPDNSLRIAMIFDLLGLSFAGHEEARLRKLLSELLSANGQHAEAGQQIFRAHNLAPNIPEIADTVKQLRALGMDEGQPT